MSEMPSAAQIEDLRAYYLQHWVRAEGEAGEVNRADVNYIFDMAQKAIILERQTTEGTDSFLLRSDYGHLSWASDVMTSYKALEQRLKVVEAEFATAKVAIAWANNSLYGSRGYFLSTNGGKPDEHHLDTPIESIKSYAREQYARAAAVEAETVERCAREAEIWDSEPLSGRSIAACIRALSPKVERITATELAASVERGEEWNLVNRRIRGERRTGRKVNLAVAVVLSSGRDARSGNDRRRSS